MRIKFIMNRENGLCKTECPNNKKIDDRIIMVNSIFCHNCINYAGIDVEGRLICKYSEGMR